MRMYEDYLMLLSPPETVKQEIARYKKASAKLIGDYKSMDSPAHISIQHLERQKPLMEDKNILLMETAFAALPPVLLHVDGFDYFPHLHNRMTIYAHIRSTPSVDQWFRHLKAVLKIKKTLLPHITIARDIPEKDFNTLWPNFKNKRMVEPFWINELKIVKRETFGYLPKWEPFKTFRFKNPAGFEHQMDVLIKEHIRSANQNQINLF
ncbi:2'-5' RNA ligase family protein [Mucilaginibacter sp. FT3.2]|uniref:2'-5' RNA ligase family protein n=1 Tax=Mucilaginibacter sp. FT3.2 TaxID=2723090 RepID=UPI001622A3B0|nr:2'-5' RNA ligase family protein [Mucilaginibacter sp. FT3.2]MBB6230476.1 2'-5' RNA ligase [Mucilaginibacter sp. FT3.2]